MEEEQELNQPNKFTPVIIAAIIITVISSIPFLSLINAFCCAGILAGGFFGTMNYQKQLSNSIGGRVQFKDAAAIGILSGIISALFVTIISLLIQMASDLNPIPAMFEMFDSQGVSLPPQIDQFLQDVSDEYNTKGFSIRIGILTLIVDIFTFPLFSTLGGMLAASLYNRRNPEPPVV